MGKAAPGWPTGLRSAALVVYFAIVATSFIGFARNSVRLRNNSREVTGTLVERRPRDHDNVVVDFIDLNGVNHRVITGLVGSPNPTKDALTIGAPVQVFYVPDDPSIAVLEKPASVQFPTRLLLLFAGLAAVVAIGLWQGQRMVDTSK